MSGCACTLHQIAQAVGHHLQGSVRRVVNKSLAESAMPEIKLGKGSTLKDTQDAQAQ